MGGLGEEGSSGRPLLPKGLLGGGFWRWRPMAGGVSEVFEFPAMPGKKRKEEAREETVLGKGEVPKPGAAAPVVDI